jgi:hypothetical protein
MIEIPRNEDAKQRQTNEFSMKTKNAPAGSRTRVAGYVRWLLPTWEANILTTKQQAL